MSLNPTKRTENQKIRCQYDEKFGEYYFSVVDVIDMVTDSSNARNYWKVQKNRLKKTHNELVTQCNRLKLKSSDGKSYLTDTLNLKNTTKLIELLAPENLDIFNGWLLSFKTPTGLSATSPFLRGRADSNSPSPLQGEGWGEVNKEINFEPENSYPQENEEEGELQVDAYQTEKEITIKTFVSFTKEKDLSIIINSHEVIIKGKKIPPENISSEDYFNQELFWGNFSRIIPLPEEIDTKKSEAIISHGVLKIKLPKINKNFRKEVRVKSN
jgi:HSP20 family molecular chaperone IbpA